MRPTEEYRAPETSEELMPPDTRIDFAGRVSEGKATTQPKPILARAPTSAQAQTFERKWSRFVPARVSEDCRSKSARHYEDQESSRQRLRSASTRSRGNNSGRRWTFIEHHQSFERT